MTLEQQLATQAAQIEMMRDFIETAPVSTGVCCCGESMEGHSSSMNCSHTPVDLWDHSVISVLSTTPDQALREWLGEPVAWMITYDGKCMGFVPTEEANTVAVYSPKGLK